MVPTVPGQRARQSAMQSHRLDEPVGSRTRTYGARLLKRVNLKLGFESAWDQEYSETQEKGRVRVPSVGTLPRLPCRAALWRRGPASRSRGPSSLCNRNFASPLNSSAKGDKKMRHAPVQEHNASNVTTLSHTVRAISAPCANRVAARVLLANSCAKIQLPKRP